MNRILQQLRSKLKTHIQKIPHKEIVIPLIGVIIVPAFLLCIMYGGLSWFLIGFGLLRLVWQMRYSKPMLHKTIHEKILALLGGFAKTLLLAAFLSGPLADIPLSLLAAAQMTSNILLFKCAQEMPDVAGFIKVCLVNTVALAASIAAGAVIGICLTSVSLAMAFCVLLIKNRYLSAAVQMQFSMA